MSSKLKFLNIEIDNLTPQELLTAFDEGVLFTPNADHLMRLQKNKDFYQCYQQATFKVCDSRIIFLLSKWLFGGKGLRAQITGSDFFPAFYQHHAQLNTGVKIFLLGGTDSSVLEAQDNINQKTKSNIVVGAYSPPFGFEKSPTETANIIERIKNSGANTLAIGVGAPKQEFWIMAHRDELPHIRRYLAIGATIEFESGNLKRAPRWMTSCGLEWLFRLGQEPTRLARRYFIDDLPIFWLLLKQRFNRYKNPWAP